MTFDGGRLRTGELIAGGGGILLLVALFVLPWSAVSGVPGSARDGWHLVTNIRWILLLTIASSLALVLFTALRRSPAVPVTMSMITTLLGGISSLLVLYRIIDHAGQGSVNAPAVAKPGIYFACVAAVAIAYGGYRSLRAESSPFGDPASVETVSPERSRAASAEAAARIEPDAAGRTASGSVAPPGRGLRP